MYMFDALVVFYFPFLSPDHRKLYKSRLDAIYKRRQVSEISQKEIEKNQSYLKKKNLTKDGKERKERIYKKLFFTKRKTRLQMSLFTAAFLTMKRYVKVFQQNEPAIYRIYPEQLNVFREFLVDFIKPEVIAENKKVSQLKKVDFKSRKNQLPQSLISIGSVAYKIVKNSKKDNPTINEFLRNAMKAYADCATYMAEKLPLENKFLKDVTATYPKEVTSCKSSTLKSLLNLPSLMENVLLDDEIDCYESECRRIIVDYDLPDVCTPDKKPVRGDLWWYKLVERYPILTKLSLAALTIFHGSFSVMGDIMDKKSGRMNVETYSAIQTVKYSLTAKASKSSKKQKTIQFFHREDRLKSPVAKKLVKDNSSAKKLYEEDLEQRKSAKQGPQNNIQITKKNVPKTSAQVEQALKGRLIEERALKTTNSSDATTSSGKTTSSKSTSATETPATSETPSLSRKRHSDSQDQEATPKKKLHKVQSNLKKFFTKK